jgi:hypothetical protein
MAYTVNIHILNEEPFVADLEALPAADATYIFVTNPRTREGRQVPWNTGQTQGFIFPMSRISYIAIMVSEQEKRDIEYFRRDRTKA